MTWRYKTLIVSALLAIVVAGWWSAGQSDRAVTRLDPAQVIVLRTPGGMLEVSTLVRNEEFGWKTSYECPLFDCSQFIQPTISEVRLPVHYTYRVPLAESWTLTPRDGHYELRVPLEQPLLPPAVDFSRMEIRTSKSWLSPGTQENREMLLKRLGPELSRRAAQPHYIDAQRDSARKTVVEFAQKWMREQGRAGAPVKDQIRVIFTPASSAGSHG